MNSRLTVSLAIKAKLVHSQKKDRLEFSMETPMFIVKIIASNALMGNIPRRISVLTLTQVVDLLEQVYNDVIRKPN